MALFAALLIASSGYSQNRATVKGKVVDSLTNEPMEFATIAILNLKDTTSSLVAYTVSDKKGEFTLHNLPAEVPIKVLITFIAYQPYRKYMTLSKAQIVDLGTIRLSKKELNEVTITGERPPIVIRKDTIEFNAEAFKTRPNAVVEDLLKKLPGVEVDNTGTITVNGRDISKILVDGHEFFSSDPRIASKNLDADLIDKVQIYDDRENDPDHLVPDIQVKKIINLKFKKALKKSIFGKVYAGAGTENRYTAGGLFNMFRDTLQVSVLGQANNLNNTGFSFDDLYQSGGFNRGGGETFYRGGLSPFGVSGSNGIQKVISSGVNINDDYGKKLKINLSYYYSHTQNDYNSITNRQSFVSDTDLITNTITGRTRYDGKHNLSATVRIQPSDATQITYNPTFTFDDNQSNSSTTGNTFSNFVSQINQSNSTDNNNGSNGQFQQSFTYNHQFTKKGESINISHSLSINPSSSVDYNDNGLTSYVSTFPSYDLNRLNNGLNRNTSTNIAVGYRYPFTKKLTGNINVSSTYSHQVNNTAVFDLDPQTGDYDSFEQTLSADLTRNQWTHSLNPGITYKFNNSVQLDLNLNTQLLQIDNEFDRGYPDINQHFLDVLPSVRLQLKNVALSYNKSFNPPNIGDMIPYSVVFSPLYAVTGNPDLQPAKRDNYSIGYNTYIPQRQMSVNANLNASFEQNGVFRERTLNNVGAETSTPINKDGRYTLSANGYINKRFKKRGDFHLSATTSLNLSKNHNFFELNHQDGNQDNYSTSINQRFSFNWKDIIELDPSVNVANTTSTYSGVDFNTVNNTTYSSDNHFNIYWPKRINIEGNYTYNYNPMVSPGFQKSSNLLSVSVARAFLKRDRGEIKLSCYDILNQAIGSNRYVFENNITDTQSQILKRYFLLTLQFKFNKSTVKEDDKPKASPLMITRPMLIRGN